MIVVEGLPGAPDQTVRYMPRGKSYTWENRRDTSTTWRGWEQGVTVDRGTRGIIPAETDIDSMRGGEWVGTWDTPGASAVDSLGGTWPLINGQRIPRLAIISVSGTLSPLGDMGYQTMALLASGTLTQTQYLIRFNQGYNRTGPEAWTEWTRLDAPDLTGEVADLDSRLSAVEAGSGVGLPTNALATGGREMRMQMFRDAYPLVSTGGKGAVVFRYDHGLTNFKNVLLPLHQQYSLPAYIAMNSRNWDLPENSGATQAEARAWANVEWGNHSADHNDKTGIEDIYEAVALGRIELEAQVGKTVHGWTVPGLPGADGNSYDKLDGFGVGYASGYSNSYAGSLILNHHAIASGLIGPQYRPLDGEIRQGGRHIGWENRAWDGPDGIKALIDEAIATKTALTLMQHPRTMNLSGYWTPELADQVLSYVREQIDAGNLANISYYQSHHAQLAALPSPTYVSGRRDVSSELINGWTGTLFVERDGPSVYFRGTLNGAAATSDIAWMLPAGFRPGIVQTPGGPIDYGAGIAWTAQASPTVRRINHYLNRFQIVGANGDTNALNINHQLRTRDAVPTSLPGDPA